MYHHISRCFFQLGVEGPRVLKPVVPSSSHTADPRQSRRIKSFTGSGVTELDYQTCRVGGLEKDNNTESNVNVIRICLFFMKVTQRA